MRYATDYARLRRTHYTINEAGKAAVAEWVCQHGGNALVRNFNAIREARAVWHDKAEFAMARGEALQMGWILSADSNHHTLKLDADMFDTEEVSVNSQGYAVNK